MMLWPKQCTGVCRAPGGHTLMPQRRPQADEDGEMMSFPQLESLAAQQIEEGQAEYRALTDRALLGHSSPSRGLKTAAYAAPSPVALPSSRVQHHHEASTISSLSLHDNASNVCSPPMLPFQPKYRSGHPENYSIVLSKKRVYRIKVSEIIIIRF